MRRRCSVAACAPAWVPACRLRRHRRLPRPVKVPPVQGRSAPIVSQQGAVLARGRLPLPGLLQRRQARWHRGRLVGRPMVATGTGQEAGLRRGGRRRFIIVPLPGRTPAPVPCRVPRAGRLLVPWRSHRQVMLLRTGRGPEGFSCLARWRSIPLRPRSAGASWLLFLAIGRS
jgi:hypothetical protein